MKKSILISSLILCVACNVIPDKKERKFVKGEWKERTYTNKLFKLKMEIPEPWDIYTKSSSTPFNNTIAKATYYEYVDTLGYPVAEFEAEFEKANPFDKTENEHRKLTEEQETFSYMYDENEMLVSPIRKVKLSNKDFYYSSFVLLEEEGDTTFIERFVRLELGYFMDFSVTYYAQKNKEQALSVLKNIQFK